MIFIILLLVVVLAAIPAIALYRVFKQSMKLDALILTINH